MVGFYRLSLLADVLDFFIRNLLDLGDYVFQHSFSIIGEPDRTVLEELLLLLQIFGLLEILRVRLPELILLLVESIALLLNHCIEGMVDIFGEFLAVTCVEVMLLHNRGYNLLTELLFGFLRQDVGFRGHIHVGQIAGVGILGLLNRRNGWDILRVDDHDFLISEQVFDVFDDIGIVDDRVSVLVQGEVRRPNLHVLLGMLLFLGWFQLVENIRDLFGGSEDAGDVLEQEVAQEATFDDFLALDFARDGHDLFRVKLDHTAFVVFTDHGEEVEQSFYLFDPGTG